MELTPSAIGERAEAAVLHALVQHGYDVYLPFGGSGRCDLVFEDGERLQRVQCKNGRLVGDVITFRTSSNTNNAPRDYAGQVEYFGVYCPALGTVYLVPADIGTTRACQLRLTEPRNGQRKGIHRASDDLFAHVHAAR